MSTRAAIMVPRGRRSLTDLQLCKSSQIKMQSLYDNSETMVGSNWLISWNYWKPYRILTKPCRYAIALPTSTSNHVTTRLKFYRGRLIATNYTLWLFAISSLGYLLKWLNHSLYKKDRKKKRRANVQGRSFTKSANIPEWQKSPCITLQTKHFLNIAAQSMQANTWPQGSNLASAVLPHKRHFTSVSLLTADNDLAWAESVSSREGGVASPGFLADALMVNRSMNWVKKEQPSFTTTPLIAPKSSKRHKGFFSNSREWPLKETLSDCKKGGCFIGRQRLRDVRKYKPFV